MSKKRFKPALGKGPYTALLNAVRLVLIDGQRQIEEAKVRTYWETGRIILVHIFKYKKRAEYGAEVIANLARDLGLSVTLLNRCVQFVEAYPKLPIGAGRLQFKWSHYRELMKISDETERKRLEAGIHSKGWNAEELIVRIKERQPFATPNLSAPKTISRALLEPLRGELYHYKIVQRPDVAPSAQPVLKIDLGFHNYLHVDARVASQFKEGDIIQSLPKNNDNYKFSKVSGADATILYTYQASVERVTDGDTFKVCFDLGFGTDRTETLRLRGIDCPEMDTKEGVAAKTFVMSYIREAQIILVHTTRDDKYGRLLVDVFLPSTTGAKEDVYLNNLLLEKDHAVRM